MSTLQKQKGPAKAATFPDHGSTKSPEGMEMNKHTNSTADAVTASVSLYRLISNYWLAYDRLMSAMDGPDEPAACEQLNASEEAVCAYVPRDLAESKVKADFVAKLAAENRGVLDRGYVTALLSSLPGLYAREVAA